MITDEEKIKKIKILEQNLVIFKNAVIKTSIDADKSFERVRCAINKDYQYREFLEEKIIIYKNAKKIAKESIGLPNWKFLNDIAIREKYKLATELETYNKNRDINSYQIADDAQMNEAEAREFLLVAKSKLLDALMDLVGDKSENLINEAELLLNEIN
jgi:hypothetical protein